METKPDTSLMEEIDLGMSNFDGQIDSGFSEALEANPGLVFGRHSAWNFNGKVYCMDGMFHEEVWTYGVISETLSSDSLESLMALANDKYGYE